VTYISKLSLNLHGGTGEKHDISFRKVCLPAVIRNRDLLNVKQKS